MESLYSSWTESTSIFGTKHIEYDFFINFASFLTKIDLIVAIAEGIGCSINTRVTALVLSYASSTS